MKKLAFWLLVCAFAKPVFGVDPTFTSTTPNGGQRGSEMELICHGARLDDAQEILFYSPGFEVLKLEEIKANQVKARVKIAPDCRLGEHFLRVRTATGVTALQSFYVGPFPNVSEKEPNNEFSQAQKIDLNVTVEGVVDREDIDYYLIEAKQGQRIGVEVEGVRLGRYLFDPYVAIQSLDGAILAESDDTAMFLQDPAVTLIAPKDGAYIVQVRESSYGGNNRCVYRVHIGDFVRPLAVYPAGGKAGETLKVTFIGDAAGEFTQEFKLPAASDEKFGLIAQREGQTAAPSPNFIRVSDFPNVLEAEPNNDLKSATATDLTLPVAFNGVIGEKGDIDFFRFTARKGQSLDIHVYAQRIRSPLDPVLNVYDAKTGRSLAGNDDSGGADSYLRFAVPEDGEYGLRVTDHLSRGGADYVYRVEVTEAGPQLGLSIPHVARFDSQSRQAMAVPKGNRFMTLISTRRENFRGDVQFFAKDLPSGVTLHADTLPNNQTVFPLVFEAAPDAPIGARMVDLKGNLVAGEKVTELPGGHSQVVDLVMSSPNNTVYYRTAVDKLAVVVTEEAPFKLTLVEPKVPLAQYGTLNLDVQVERQEGFDDPINVQLPYRPPGISANPTVTIPKGATNVSYAINSNASAETRKSQIAVAGFATVKGGTLWVSSQLAALEVVPRFLLGKFETSTVEQGQTVKLVCKLDQKEPFEGTARLQLFGLPANTTAQPVEITKDSQEAVFEVITTEKSTLGLSKSLFCQVFISQNSETIRHTVATGGILRIDKPQPKAAQAPAQQQVAAASAK